MTLNVGTDDRERCAHCGEPVSRRGRKPKLGRRYHSDRPDCVAARHRALYQMRKQGKPTPQEVPTSCTCCGQDLPPRNWREGDGIGRWCDRPNCRAHRNLVRSQVFTADKAELLAENEHLKTVVQFLSEVVMADWDRHLGSNRVTCSVCFNADAIEGWGHADEIGQPCLGTLNGMPPRVIGIAGRGGAWPTPPRFDFPDARA